MLWEIFPYQKINSNRNYLGMRFLIHTGLLVLLIISVTGRALHEDENKGILSTSYNEEPSENNCNCEWRYYKHYEAKGCKVVQVDACGCPKKYLCPLLSDSNEEQKLCIYQNQEYKLGSKINVTDKCQSCRCLGGDEPQITCRHRECPQLQYVGDKNCHLVYEKDKCCPSKYECVLNLTGDDATDEGSFCVYKGVSYPLGAKIYPSDDPCMICECTDAWRGIDNSSCYQQNCLFEKNKKLLQKGCIPVYHENKCCPIEFYCPENLSLSSNILLENALIEERSKNLDSCLFDGKFYEIGMELLMKNPCIKCNCIVPPDFTCVHRSCPPPPPSSIKNCEVVYSSNYCCPSYECSNDDDIITADVESSSGTACPTPVCADATCEIKIPEGHHCPTCICDDSIVHEINVFEPTELIIEGSLKNGSLIELEEPENESFEAEVLIPIESNFFINNTNKSEKFVDNSSDKEDVESSEKEGMESSEKVDMESPEIQGKESTEKERVQSSEKVDVQPSEKEGLESSEKEGLESPEIQIRESSEKERVQSTEKVGVQSSEKEGMESSEKGVESPEKGGMESSEKEGGELFEKDPKESSEKERVEYDEIEHLEYELDEPKDIFNEERKFRHSSEKSMEDQGKYADLESSLNSNSNISFNEVLTKSLRKRSVLNQAAPFQQQNGAQSNHFAQHQQQFFEEENTESDREISEDSDEGFDELKLSSRNRKSEGKAENTESNLDEEDLISSESIFVPAGCPTPLCATSSCKIEIPYGQRCPTCVCKDKDNWQP